MAAAAAAATVVAHPVTSAQLEAVIRKALSKVDEPGPLILVRADPATVPTVSSVNGQTIHVHGVSSPLQARALLDQHDQHEPLVLVTNLADSDLGHDLIARSARRTVTRPDRWAIVAEMFGAQRLSAEDDWGPDLADALIEARPLHGYRRVTSRVLSLDHAIGALIQEYLQISSDVTGLDGFLRWVSQPEMAGRIAQGRALLQEQGPVVRQLRHRFGPGTDAVLAALEAGEVDRLIPLGLVAGILHHPDGPNEQAYHQAQGSLSARLSRAQLTPDAFRAWGTAAERLLRSDRETAEAAGWYDTTERLLDEVGAGAYAHLSDVVRRGFGQRITQAAAALTDRWPTRSDDAAAAAVAAAAADQAIKRARSHAEAARYPDRLDRLDMAARLLRRDDLHLTGLTDLHSSTTSYLRDGAWLDAARTVVSRGDADPTLNTLCQALAAAAEQARHDDGPRMARSLAEAAHRLPDSMIGVEDILDRVVGPLARQRPVLLVVLDGLGWPALTQILDDLRDWEQWRHPTHLPDQTAVAALPTITRTSRTSLLAGTLRDGDQSSEQRAFAGHPALQNQQTTRATRATRRSAAPRLFHKAALRAGGLDSELAEPKAAVRDAGQHIVGVVLNDIDERLAKVRPPDRWNLAELRHLRELLDAARDAGRVVVLTADHGHILDRDAQQGPASDGRGGERWRPADGPAPTGGEVEVSGERVLAGEGTIVLPWQEQLRYAMRQNGYHGGLTPQELFVPLLVLTAAAAEPTRLEGWEPVGTRRPAWWHSTPLLPRATSRPAPLAGAAGAPAGGRPPHRAVADSGPPSLFDTLPDAAAAAAAAITGDPAAATGNEAEAEASTAAEAEVHGGEVDDVGGGAGPDWLGPLLASDQFARQRQPRIRLTDDELRRMLVVLDAMGDMGFPESRLAEEAALPPARIGRYIAQLQGLLNVDGYPVVTAVGGQVRFDLGLLKDQFLL